MDEKATKISPMMEQWHQCKSGAGEALLLFRLGDFYEAFYDDATILASTLELTLTQRQGVPMSGIPAVSLDTHLDKLVKAGFLVAIADQVEKSGESKGLVKREIVRIVSSATHITSLHSSERSNHFFACATRINTTYGLALLDLHTGEMVVSELESEAALVAELYKASPAELLLSKKFPLAVEGIKRMKEDWYFDLKMATDKICKHFAIHSLDTFGLGPMTSGVVAAGSLLRYLGEDLSHSLAHVQKIRQEMTTAYMGIDPTTAKHLELGKLLEHIDFTATPMGSRLLKHWLMHPLLSVEKIEERQQGVEFFLHKHPYLGKVRDLERLVMRLQTGHTHPRDLVSLSESLKQIPAINEHLQTPIAPLPDVIALIDSAIVSEPPHRLSDGNVFRFGFHAELDEIRALRQNSQTWLANYQTHLQESLNIKTLKVSYTKAFGYYIEVSRGQVTKVPDSFERKQTLLGGERYTTPELKEYERKILHADVLIQDIENELFKKLVQDLLPHAKAIQVAASAIGQIDALLALATAAKKYGWVRPRIHHGEEIRIVAGRHPLVEAVTPFGTFIPNDTLLNGESKLILLTGPNMAGKSTYIRQVALIAILAQVGSFVPAAKAELGIVDKVFSRIGASDDLSKGSSTFMVEMTETAHILHNATARSLVILDEIGRGTSTYDGISIAWAVAEYLLKLGPKTLFATHYAELTELAGVKNFRVAVHEAGDGIVFLHKIVPGGADKSYGIHVAKLAGLPREVILRASVRLADLESAPVKKKGKEKQLTLFADDKQEEEVLQALSAVDLNELSPMEALLLLAEWKKKL